MSERAAVSTPLPIVGTRGDAATMGAFVIAAAGALLRLLLVFRDRIDSDETQHLHVVWGWTHGLVQYRDFFDNHMPLFHLLAAPLLLLAGERPETLLLARLAMIPLVAAMAVLAYRIARSCYPPRIAMLATLAGCLAPDFFLCSTEFRTDVLWALFWLASIAILVTAPLTARRAAAAGLMLGLAAAVSAKTVMLAVALVAAALIAQVVRRRHLVLFLAAAVVPPALVGAYFAAIGAWDAFVYCTVSHNLIVHDHPQRLLLLPAVVAIIALVTRHLLREEVEPDVRRRRVFLFLAASLYAGALITLWPVIQTEHWLPFYPLAGAAMAPIALQDARGLRPRLTVALLALELFWNARDGMPWRDRVTPALATIEQAMRLTTPGERVIDLKGEIVFRRRAFDYVLEKMTKKKLSKGHLRDTIAADILRTGAMVAVRDTPTFPPHARAFLLRNFVSIGCVRVPGMVVRRHQPFTIEVPAPYAVLSQHRPFQGTLDGTPYTGPRFLGTGPHTLVSAAPADVDAVVWQRAAALGYSPFAPDRRCSE